MNVKVNLSKCMLFIFSGRITTCAQSRLAKAGVTTKSGLWTLDWTGLWTRLNYGLTRKMLKLFSIAFYSVVSTTKFM